jgi:cytidylate kinase
MENILKNYFERKFQEEEAMKPTAPRPIVTISREFGCPSKEIAQMLTLALNKLSNPPSDPKWRYINKEIVEESARKLDMKTVDINYMISSGNKGIFEDLLTSFSPIYVSNRKIQKTLNDVIRTLATQGHIIFVGRGSVAIMQGHPHVLHIRLQAPLDWRVERICVSRNLTEKEATRLTLETDRKRTELIELLLGHKFHQNLFDLIFNSSTFSKEETVQSILGSMKARKMI